MVTIIPKLPKKVSQWQTIIFYSSLAALLAVMAAYFVLNHLHGQSLAAINDLEEQILEISTIEDTRIETEIFASQEKIKDFSKILSAHAKSSQFFEFLEGKTHPEVWFTDLDLNPDMFSVRLSGKALNFQTLAQQLYIFQAEDLIESVTLTDFSLGEEGATDFSFNISFSPEVLK